VPLSSFFEFRGPPAIDGLVVRRSPRKKVVLSHIGLLYELLTPDLKRKLTMIQTSVPPRFDNRERPFQHEGDECLLITDGQLDVFVGKQNFTLEAGDSITYDSGKPHWWHNRGSAKVELIGAITPSVF